MMWTPPPLVLASGSPRRLELLAQIGADVTVEVADVDETPLPGEGARALVERLAELKARTVLTTTVNGTRLVLGADTVVSLHGKLMGKPTDNADASAMLRALRGTTHDVWTGVWLGSASRGVLLSDSVRTVVSIRDIDDNELADYVATGEPLGKAGGYAIQGRGATLVASIEGDYYAVVGLPLSLLWSVLRSEATPAT